MPTTWTSTQVVGLQVQTQYPLALTVLGSNLFCLWVDTASKNLVFSILTPNDVPPDAGSTFWTQRTATAKQNVGPDRLSGPPAVASLDGIVHVVFADQNKNLVHYQYVDNVSWGKRCGVVAQSSEPPALATFQGQLCCVYKDATSNKLALVKWTPQTGWTVPLSVGVDNVPETGGQMALFELNAELQLMAAKVTANKGEIIGFSSADGSTWNMLPADVLGSGIISTFGINASCYNSNAFMVYANETNVWTKHFSTGKWQANERQSNTQTSATPSIAVLDNQVVCVWPDNNGALTSMTRQAWNIPPLHAWTSLIDDQYYITELTIPGMHDAVSRTEFLWAGTQSSSITDLLWQGVRYFDLRGSFMKFFNVYYELSDPKFSNDDDLTVYVVHNDVPIFHPVNNADGTTTQELMTMESVFKELYKFLQQNKNETILVQIKQDAGADDADAATNFANQIQQLITRSSTKWSLQTNVPTMKDVRGKIQLIRRYPLNRAMPFGIDLNDPVWNGSAVITLPALGAPRAQIQDIWQFFGWALPSIVATKFAAVTRHLNAAVRDGNNQVLYLNFCSANGLPKAEPSKIALGSTSPGTNWSWGYSDGINAQVNSFFNSVTTPGRYGVILLDFAESPAELILGIIKTNANKFKRA